MSHDRCCWKCWKEPWEWHQCTLKNCTKRREPDTVTNKNIGAAVFTIIRLALPNGKFEDVQVTSADAVLAVLRDPRVRKLETGEPFFVLRGQDRSASGCVEDWADENRGTLSDEKYQGALSVADEMRRWPNRRRPT